MKKKTLEDPKRRPAKGIPFVALVASPGWERNARMELENPNSPPELRAQIKRYLDNPFGEAAKDQARREKVFNDLLDGREKVGTDNLVKLNKQQSKKFDAEALKAVDEWRNDPVRCSRLLDLSLADVVKKYLRQHAKPPRRQASRLKTMLQDGRIK